VTYVLREARVSLAKSCGLRYVQIMRNSSRGMSSRAAIVSFDSGGWKTEEDSSEQKVKYLST
jgi:hypothetical protein